MQFTSHKHRQAPAVIIVSLIDVLLVVLIYLVVTTMAKQQPAIKLALPQSSQQKAGASDNSLVVTISKQGPLYLKRDPVTLDILQKRLMAAVQANPKATLSIRADTEAPVGQVVKVMDAARATGITIANLWTANGQTP
ncbi:MAG: ExbD/TolR family protein [Limisphaerales bacterium]